MKRIAFTMVAVLYVFATSFAAGNQPVQNIMNKPWEGEIYVNNLSKYLQLTSNQHEQVDIICEFFNVQMSRAHRSTKHQSKYLHQAVYAHLKLMKETLNEKQYAEYTRLLNLTLYNKGIELK